MRFETDSEIPFGPGLCAATAIVVGMQLAGLPVPPL
jgi:shikimate kinase